MFTAWCSQQSTIRSLESRQGCAGSCHHGSQTCCCSKQLFRQMCTARNPHPFEQARSVSASAQVCLVPCLGAMGISMQSILILWYTRMHPSTKYLLTLSTSTYQSPATLTYFTEIWTRSTISPYEWQCLPSVHLISIFSQQGSCEADLPYYRSIPAVSNRKATVSC